MTDPRTPAEDLQTALARAIDQAPLEGVDGLLATFAATVAVPEDGAPVRAYRPREVAVILGICAAFLLAFDSEGLMTWVQRMDLGPVQSAWRATVGPLNAGLDRLGLTVPRRLLVSAGDGLGRALGAGEDQLLAEGWSTPDAPQSPPEPPSPAAPEESIAALAPELPAPVGPEDPVVPSKPAPVAVLLMGDSMIAGSLGASISRVLARDRRLRVVQAFQTATGLSRPDIYDWMKVLPPLLEREAPRLIVCSLGANDPTTILDGDRELDFTDAGWRSAYAARVVGLMRALTGTGARVLWLGLPPMRAGRFSAHVKFLNGIFAQAAKSVPGVEFLELRMLVSNRGGEYTTFVRGPDGRLLRYRLDDGVHYSPAGAWAISRWVVDWIYERYRKLP